jgi:putative CocE/NonD family hydrolase
MLVIERNVAVTMRDGIRLVADIYRDINLVPRPTLVQRTPYGKDNVELVNSWLKVTEAVLRGYTVVVQDCRGRYASQGKFDPFAHEASDGADTIAWAAAQPWSDGWVGMFGGSYVGATAWLAATANPPALRAIAPAVTSDSTYESWSYQGGATQLGFLLTWVLGPLATGQLSQSDSSATPGELKVLADALDSTYALANHMTEALTVLAQRAPYLATWLDHPSYDDFWRQTSPAEQRDAVTVPSMNIGGWFDLFLLGTLRNYRAMRERAGDDPRRQARLVIGPWAHGQATGCFPERDFGVRAGAGGAAVSTQQLDWFDRVRADSPVSVGRPVRIFVMGPNVWRDEVDWPLPDTEYRALHLTAASGLSWSPPMDDGVDVFRYDPADPVPTVGGATFLPGIAVSANAGPRDQRRLDDRIDVLRYVSDPLPAPLEVIGEITATVFFCSDVPDTDLTVKLIDLHPDGRAELVTDGIRRGRHRNSTAVIEPLDPDQVNEISVEVGATATVFAAGHRLRVDISGSNFPRFDRNPNTGGASALASEYVVATNQVIRSGNYPSRVTLPVIPL